jgi:hypothetical protein
MDGGPIFLAIAGKPQANDAQREHWRGLAPILVGLNEAGEESRKLRWLLLGSDDKSPRLFVVRRGRPACGFEQRANVGRRDWSGIEAVRAPPPRQKLVNGMICGCCLFES